MEDYSNNGILCRHKKEWTTDLYNSVDVSYRPAEWDRETWEYLLYDSLYVMF